MNKLTGIILYLSVAALMCFIACNKNNDPVSPETKAYKSIKMAVFSDPHFYDSSLGSSGAAFEQYIMQDRKMIAESQALMEQTVDIISNENVDIVLVAGDLTKDGEKQCHEKMAELLDQIEASGKKVYVVPGNHDIDNANAASYQGDSAVSIPSVTAAEFREIYKNFGYDEAIYTDAASLSYIAQPADSIWIMALDVCNYAGKFDALGISKTGGAISTETMNWIKEKMQEANAKNITVFGLLHHGVVEHFANMEVLFGEYLLHDWRNMAQELAETGVNLVFTGHHHATDISELMANDSFILDVQTGSTVTWQCPYRIVDFQGSTNSINIENKVISSINYDTNGQDFQTYAKNFLAAGMPALVIYQLTSMGIDQQSAEALEPMITASMIAYYHGDEATLPEQAVMNTQINGFMSVYTDPISQMLGLTLLDIWNDATPDNSVMIDLNTGAITKN